MPGFFFPGAGRQECVEQLQHLLRFSGHILLLSGLEGSGRSTVRDHLLGHAEQDISLCSLNARLLRGSDSLLDEILSEFDLGNSSTESALQEFCLGEGDAGRLCWLLIDDAQHLSELEIRLLARLREICGESLHIALFGPASMEEELARRMPEGVAVYTLRLESMSSEEVQAYIDYRFRTAGGDSAPLSEQQYQVLAQQARGNLVKLHSLAVENLKDAVRRGPAPMAGLPRSHLILVSLMILVVAALYAFDQEEEKETKQQQIPSISMDRQRVEVLATGPSKSQDDALAAHTEPAEVLTPEEPDQSLPGPDQGLDDSTTSSELTSENTGAVPAQSSAPAALADVSQPESQEGPAIPAKQSFVYGNEGRRGGAPDADEAYLMRMPRSAWTVQLMGSHDPQTINSFRQRYNSLDSRLYRKLRNGKDWYVMVHGNYASRAQAIEAVAGLPSRLRRMQPWVRAIADIQQEIRAARALP